MRILMSPMGSAGDVFPFLGVALELKRRGHDVTIYTADHFRKLTESLGLSFMPLGKSGAYEEAIQNPDLWHPRKGFAYIFKAMVEPVLEEQCESVRRWTQNSESIAVCSCFGMGALTAADAFGATIATVHLQPAVLFSRQSPPALPGIRGPRWFRNLLISAGQRFIVDPVALPPLNKLRAKLHLPPVKNAAQQWLSKSLNLLMFPNWFAPAQSDWPANCVQVPFPLWEANHDSPLPQPLLDFLAAGSKPIAVTLGSANVHAADHFRHALKAIGALGKRALLLTSQREQLPPNLPPEAFHAGFVPLQNVLPRCSMLISHGGVGTVSQGLRAQIPQIVVPLAHDQFDNGERLGRLGVGDVVPPTHALDKKLINAILNLDSSETQKALQTLSQRHDLHQNGLAQAAEAIEKLET